jgi:UDP-N-acetylmuramoylalanine--D-glutamate ligase
VAGLRSVDPSENTIILLAGGKDKYLPWDTFAQEVLDRVTFLIGFGQSGAMIVEKVRERAHFLRRSAPSIAVVQRLDEAVELAARSARPGAIVLLSPGGTSYDAYRDFEARGEHFRALVEQYCNLNGGAHLSA